MSAFEKTPHCAYKKIGLAPGPNPPRPGTRLQARLSDDYLRGIGQAHEWFIAAANVKKTQKNGTDLFKRPVPFSLH
ncbi:hypothetical protein P3C24_20685 [Pseudomonas proteolytica]|uniref:hypothetical protein n=1 Tax=Pseudomonas proteolytica TaxID=219574 RepID=UPI0023E025F1|nr:hypothetical protein [Pseudomonas proteolytica]MDF3163365.1 hypothetical protein [Pseudomonas proteolytica]